MLYKELENLVETEIVGKHDNDTLMQVISYISRRIEDIEKQLKEEE